MKKTNLLTLFYPVILGMLLACSDPLGKENPDKGEPPEKVSSLEILSLEFGDRIRLIWAPSADADSYKIYRYQTRDENILDRVFFSKINNFDDTSAIAGTLYYYKVAAVKKDLESEKSAGFFPGIHGLTADLCEPNNSPDQAKNLVTGKTDCLIYNFDEGAEDLDYYYLPGEDGFYTITIEISGVLENRLCLTLGKNSPVKINGLSHSLDLELSKNNKEQIISVSFTSAEPGFNALACYSIIIEKI